MTGRLSSFADLLVPVQPEGVFCATLGEAAAARPPCGKQLLRSAPDQSRRRSGHIVGRSQVSGHPTRRGGGFFPPETFTRTIRSAGDFFTGIPTSTAFVRSINPVLPFRCRGSTGLGSRSGRSPLRSRRSSTMRYTQTSISLPGTPSVSVPTTTRTRSSCFRSPAASAGASTSTDVITTEPREQKQNR